MDQHTRRLAAASYDRGRGAARLADDRAIFVSVELGGGARRTLLCDVVLGGMPPESLRRAVAETLDVLRVTWMALLRREEGLERRQLEAAHAAIQCELAAAEFAWSQGVADARALGRTLAARRERHRQALAMPAPQGAGILVPAQARANEALPEALEGALRALLRTAAGCGRSRRQWLEEAAYAALGGWRLGEVGADVAAAAIEWLLDHDVDAPAAIPAPPMSSPAPSEPAASTPPPAASERPTPLRAAS